MRMCHFWTTALLLLAAAPAYSQTPGDVMRMALAPDIPTFAEMGQPALSWPLIEAAVMTVWPNTANFSELFASNRRSVR
jgi:hypothetical protein